MTIATYGVNGSVLTRKDDALFLGDVKLVLRSAIDEDHEGDRTMNRWDGLVAGDDVVECIFLHPELTPECWKVEDGGEPRRIFHSQGHTETESGPFDWVVYMFWSGGKWNLSEPICEFEWEDFGANAYDIVPEGAVGR